MLLPYSCFYSKTYMGVKEELLKVHPWRTACMRPYWPPPAVVSAGGVAVSVGGAVSVVVVAASSFFLPQPATIMTVVASITTIRSRARNFFMLCFTSFQFRVKWGVLGIGYTSANSRVFAKLRKNTALLANRVVHEAPRAIVSIRGTLEYVPKEVKRNLRAPAGQQSGP
jgi:hypothetical protein